MLEATLVREKKDSWRESVHLHREYVNNYAQNVGRNVDVKGHSVEISRHKYSMLVETRRKVKLVIK